MNPWILVTILSVGGCAVTCLLALLHNRLVALNEKCENAFGQIEVQLKRRYDLIPNLVDCVKSCLIHERETLQRVVAARDRAAAGLREFSGKPRSPERLQNWLGAESSLVNALGRLSVAIESYPELKANGSVADLAEQLTTTENRIAFARQAYNDWVNSFNAHRQTLPTCLFAGLFGFVRNRDFLEFADPEALAEAPQVVLA